MTKLSAYLLILPLHFTLQMINLAVWGCLVLSLGLIRLALPQRLQRHFHWLMESCENAFGVIALEIMYLFNGRNVKFTPQGELSPGKSYLIVANHLSYVDIILLIGLADGRYPAPKFFLKHSLLYLPFVGLGAWALDMPFMRRYSAEYLAQHPDKVGHDLLTTQRACEKFAGRAITIINFAEGTRYSQQKQKRTQSPYQYLLKPKAGGSSLVLQMLGAQMDGIIDVTIAYANETSSPLIAMLSGQLARIDVHAEILPVQTSYCGDYLHDTAYKAHYQDFINHRWQIKDQRLAQIKNPAQSGVESEIQTQLLDKEGQYKGNH